MLTHSQEVEVHNYHVWRALKIEEGIAPETMPGIWIDEGPNVQRLYEIQDGKAVPIARMVLE